MPAPKKALERDFREDPPPTPQSDAVVTVENGTPTPGTVTVTRNGTVQFVNHDPVDYRLRLSTRDGKLHPDVDLLLSGRCGVTVIVDQDLIGKGKCYYHLFPIDLNYLSFLDKTDGESQSSDRSENPPRQEKKDKKGPGGGIITVP
jgi:hypothetical protein